MGQRRYHNKKRNSALLYEFLIRHISNCLINENKKEAKKTLEISKKYFSKGSELYKELSLFNAVLNTNVKSRESAAKIINEVFPYAEKINARRLDNEKSKLIKEINHKLSSNVYNYKVPEYKIYASMQTLFSDKRNKKKLPIIERIKIEDNLIEHLMKPRNSTKVELKKNPNYNNAVYKFIFERFHKKYDGKLNEDQKKLLIKYSLYLASGDKNLIKEAIQKNVETIKKSFKVIKDESILNDSEVSKKLNESYKKVVTSDFLNPDDKTVLEVLQYLKLVEELNS